SVRLFLWQALMLLGSDLAHQGNYNQRYCLQCKDAPLDKLHMMYQRQNPSASCFASECSNLGAGHFGGFFSHLLSVRYMLRFLLIVLFSFLFVYSDYNVLTVLLFFNILLVVPSLLYI